FGTRLNFLPIVLGDGRIHLEVEPEVSNLDPASGVAIPGGGFVPGRSTQSVRTTVELETGQTFIIGGLIQRNVRGTIQKVPILGDLPFFGTAFSRKNYEEVEEELVVMVTPYLVDALACNQVPKFLPGQETRSPDDFELFLEGILEAPRGQRYACQAGRYVPAHRTGPTAELFPCFNGCNGPYGGVCGPEGCVPGTPAGATMGGGTAPAAASSGARPVADEPPVRSLPDPVTIPANPSGDGERQP
ncbi:MAG TPA: hypothetical protein VNK04_24700, partial [Gemmataceae bacterium]|nr:hypothetical protein [Gemmataceae bacterium]